MEDNGILRKLVEVRNGAEEDGGTGGDGDQFARAGRLKGRKERIGIVSYGEDLEWASACR